MSPHTKQPRSRYNEGQVIKLDLDGQIKDGKIALIEYNSKKGTFVYLIVTKDGHTARLTDEELRQYVITPRDSKQKTPQEGSFYVVRYDDVYEAFYAPANYLKDDHRKGSGAQDLTGITAWLIQHDAVTTKGAPVESALLDLKQAQPLKIILRKKQATKKNPAQVKSYHGKFNWYGELHTLHTEASSSAQAFNKMTAGLAKKLGRTVKSVRDYFQHKAMSYTIVAVSGQKNPAEEPAWGKVAAKYDLGNGVVLKVQKQVDWDDWVVRYFKNGKYSEAKSSFHGNDKQDALDSAASMVAKAGQKGYKSNPAKKPVEVYANCLEIRAMKSEKSNWPKELFKHEFKKGSEARIFGNPDGSLTIKSAKGKKLWKNFNYDK